MTFPSSADLLPDVEEMKDQLSIPACTGNAGASILELIYHRAGQSKDFSRLDLYYDEREMSGRIGQAGSSPASICLSLQKNGICLESTWPYDESKVDVKPPPEADAEGLLYRITSYAWPAKSNDIPWLKQCILDGTPVAISFPVTQSFMDKAGTYTDWKQTFWLPTPNANNPHVGDHEVYALGWNDASRQLLLANSWGADWGDGGFFGMPYDYLETWGIVTSMYAITDPGQVKLVPLIPNNFYSEVTVHGWYNRMNMQIIQSGVAYWRDPAHGGAKSFCSTVENLVTQWCEDWKKEF